MPLTDLTFTAASGNPMRAALASPDTPGRYAGVIVIHEIFGLNDDIRKISMRLASLGYVALAPDLYDGPSSRILCIVHTMAALRSGEGQAFADLDAARDFLCQQPNVDSSKIGVIGFCMGGGFALLYAVRAPVGVAGVFYGDVPKSKDKLHGVCPVLGSYGGGDRFFRAAAERLEQQLTELRVDHDVKTYPDAGHSFMSQHTGVLATIGAYGPMGVGYNLNAAEDSWKRIESFFGHHLKGTASRATSTSGPAVSAD